MIHERTIEYGTDNLVHNNVQSADLKSLIYYNNAV